MAQPTADNLLLYSNAVQFSGGEGIGLKVKARSTIDRPAGKSGRSAGARSCMERCGGKDDEREDKKPPPPSNGKKTPDPRRPRSGKKEPPPYPPATKPKEPDRVPGLQQHT